MAERIAINETRLLSAPGIIDIQFNRPEVLNAWNPRMAQELGAAIELVRIHPECRAVVLSGALSAVGGLELVVVGLPPQPTAVRNKVEDRINAVANFISGLLLGAGRLP